MNSVILKSKRDVNLIANALVDHHQASGKALSRRIETATNLPVEVTDKLQQMLGEMHKLMNEAPDANGTVYLALVDELVDIFSDESDQVDYKIGALILAWAMPFGLYDLAAKSISWSDYQGVLLSGICQILILAIILKLFISIKGFFSNESQTKSNQKLSMRSVKAVKRKPLLDAKPNVSVTTVPFGVYGGERHCGEYDQYGWARINPTESISVDAPWARL